MQHAFDKLFTLLNTLLNFADQESLLHNICNQMFDVVEDLNAAFSRKKAEIKDREARIESIKEEVRVAHNNVERTQNLADFHAKKSDKKTEEIRKLKEKIKDLEERLEKEEEDEYLMTGDREKEEEEVI